MKMKLSQLSAALFTILTLAFFTGCKDDDNDVLPANVTIADFSTTIVENPADGAVLGTPTATTDRGMITYSIIDQTPANAIDINPVSGELTVADASLFNFEVNPVFTATLVASVEQVSETATLTINLEDVAETVNVTPFAITIDENPINGTNLGAVSAASDAGATLTFSLVAGGNAAALNIDDASGELFVSDSLIFDYEINPVVSAVFEVSNGATSEQGSITITLNNVPDVVTASPFSVTIDENPAINQVLGNVAATSDAGGSLTFSLVAGNNASAFSINAATGELTVADVIAFDFETNQTLTATYEADNGTVKAQNTITITLNNVAETVTTTNLEVTIDENATTGQVLGTLSATSDGSNGITYTLESGANSTAFALNASTGELTVADASQFDFETNPTLTATYSANADDITETGNITITLNDVYESTQRPLILVYNVVSNDLEISLQPAFGLASNFDVDWGDGTISLGLTGNTNHTYATAGQYEVKVYGTFPGWRNFGNGQSSIIELRQWGDHQYEHLNYSFAYTRDFTITATDTPDFSQLTKMVGCFTQAVNFQGNGNLSTWDVSNVTDMLTIFRSVDNFQGDVSGWVTSSVTILREAFAVIGGNPTQPFNQDISGWDVSSVTDFSFAFGSNNGFNQDISGWVTSSGTTMFRMFYRASNFNRSLASWDLGSVLTISEIIAQSGLSMANYDATLNGWANNPNTPDNLTMAATGLEYSDVTGRNILLGKGWTITGDTYIP